MIAVAAVAEVDDFESLLDKTVENLQITIRSAPSMGSIGFEDTVLRAMNSVARGTPFEGEIRKTKRGEFPDITAIGHYGVEAKQVQKDKTRTTGNSIFESTRVEGVQAVYLVMSWNAAQEGGGKVGWKRYEDAVSNVVITHSPRYLLNIELPEGESLFDKINTPYDDFRQLPRQIMMEEVRGLYEEGGRSDLWWIDARRDSYRRPYVRFEDAPTDTQAQLVGETFFLCPMVFGNSRKWKYFQPTAYWLSQGYVSHSVRDKFSAGGKVKIGLVSDIPQIIKKAMNHKKQIFRAARNVDADLIQRFWEIPMAPPPGQRLDDWFLRVRRHYRGPSEHMNLLASDFEITLAQDEE